MVVLVQYPLNNASPALANARSVNPTIATSLTPNLSPIIPPTIWPIMVNRTTIPPTMALYLPCDHSASLIKISITMGSTNNESSESRHKKINRNEDRVENPWTMW